MLLADFSGNSLRLFSSTCGALRHVCLVWPILRVLSLASLHVHLWLGTTDVQGARHGRDRVASFFSRTLCWDRLADQPAGSDSCTVCKYCVSCRGLIGLLR